MASDQPPSPKRRPGAALPLALLLFAGALGAGAFLFLRPPPATSSAPDGGPNPVAPAPDPEPPPQEAPVEPEVDPSTGQVLSPDELLRRVAAQGSPSPELAAWLSAEGVLRRIAAAVLLASQGRSPRALLSFIPISQPFKVVDTLVASGGRGEDRILMSPESPARYDFLARVLQASDAAAWGRGYRRLRPHFNAVFAEVAEPGQRFDEVLSQAVRRVLAAEVPEGPIELVEKGAVFHYADPRLEALSELEKHLIRMGPTNTKAVQESARIFARAAGLAVE